MSADNGIYILKLKDQYRVIEAQAIGNLYWSFSTFSNKGENMNKFDKTLKDLRENFPDVNISLLECYLCNFDDEYICRKYNGGCKSINVCEIIKKGESIQ